jgi:hypothetical protein
MMSVLFHLRVNVFGPVAIAINLDVDLQCSEVIFFAVA